MDAIVNAVARGLRNMLMVVLAMGFGIGVIHILTIAQLMPPILLGN